MAAIRPHLQQAGGAGLYWQQIARLGRLPRVGPPAYAAAHGRRSPVQNNKHQDPMNDAANNELERFLAAHPAVRFFDAFVNDLNTIERGKRIDRAAITRCSIAACRCPAPCSRSTSRVAPSKRPAWVSQDGDADRPCLPIPRNAGAVPWQQDVAQVQLRMHEHRRRALLRRSARASSNEQCSTHLRRWISRRWWQSNTSSTWWMRNAPPMGQPQPPRAR